MRINKGENMLKDNRKFIVVMLLSIVTLGIYGMYLTHVMARDTNVACSGDGKHTKGLIAMILLTILTFGIYSIIWQVSIISRWTLRAETCTETPKCTILIWLLCNVILSATIIAPIFFQYRYLAGFNQVCRLHNESSTVNTAYHKPETKYVI